MADQRAVGQQPATQRTGFTTRASCLLAAGATALVCGLTLGIVDLARAGVLAVAVPVLAYVVITRSRVRIANRRTVEPTRVASGDTVVVNLTLTNRSLIPSGPLMLEDQLPVQFTGRARFAIDGLLGRESRTVSYRMPRLPRGRYRTGPLHLRLTDPFHLVDIRRSFTATSEVLVTPIVDGLPGGEPPRSVDIGDDAGSHSIGTRGADDASTREYRTGDDLRKIHWRSSARTGTLQVRQEERPWQGQLSLLLDLRTNAHVEAPAASVTPGMDERVRSSLEWAISAAASIGSHALVAGRGLDLLHDLAVPKPLAVTTPSQLNEILATASSSGRPDLTPFDGALQALSQESTVIAVLGEIDPATLDILGQVHPRGTSRMALALVLDVVSWSRGPHRGSGPGSGGSDRSTTDPSAIDPSAPDPLTPDSPVWDTPVSPRCAAAVNVLRSAGWQAAVVRCGEPIAQAWTAVTAVEGAATRATAVYR